MEATIVLLGIALILVGWMSFRTAGRNKWLEKEIKRLEMYQPGDERVEVNINRADGITVSMYLIGDPMEGRLYVAMPLFRKGGPRCYEVLSIEGRWNGSVVLKEEPAKA